VFLDLVDLVLQVRERSVMGEHEPRPVHLERAVLAGAHGLLEQRAPLQTLCHGTDLLAGLGSALGAAIAVGAARAVPQRLCHRRSLHGPDVFLHALVGAGNSRESGPDELLVGSVVFSFSVGVSCGYTQIERAVLQGHLLISI